jgi:4-amino-4-deoxy-L-arabinose transferase-like glycosyltransferase
MIATVRNRRWIVVLWACFLARLLFYSAVLPLWEGYDEWAHFAVVRQMAVGGHVLVPRDAPVPRDVEASLQLAPVPWELRSLPPPAVTQDEYWKLAPEERARRQSALREMPNSWGREDGTGALQAYEALQPPLYYWAMAPAIWILRGSGLLAQVLALRFFSSLLASLTVPLVFLVGREVWDDSRLAVACAAVVAVMPGLALDVARVGNDSLAAPLFTLLTWLAVKAVRRGMDFRLTVAMGLVLGFGLLTKAYFLTAIPSFLAVGWLPRRRFSDLPRMLPAIGIGIAIAGWWYVRNLRTTGTLSGLSEAVILRPMSAFEMVRRSAGINWWKAVDSIFFSHLYFGGWSSLTVRSWMYHIFYIGILAAAIGVFRVVRRPAVGALLAVYLSFWLGQLYNVVMLYLSKGLPGSMGWYMYAVVAAEVTLCVAGLRGLLPRRVSPWIPATIPVAGATLFALLDLYTVHAVAIPYYTGMVRHRANGSLEAFHWAGLRSVGIGQTVERLSGFVPPALLVGLWLLYLAGIAGSLACARTQESPYNGR